MDRRLMYVSFAFAAALLYFVAIGYAGWECNGGIFSAHCLRRPYIKMIGALQVTAALIILTVGVLLILLIIYDYPWSTLVACILAGISVFLSMVGIIYHANVNRNWSPTIITVAMTLSVALASNLIFDLLND